MATSGSFNVSTNNSYISGTVTWSESSVNDTANTSVVTATMKLSRTNSGYTSYGTDTFYVTINGTKTSATKDYTLTYNSNTTMVSGSQTVTHNSDGSKSITISWGGGGGSGGVFTVNSGSGTAKLTTIPRGSTITSDVSWTAGTGSLAVTLQTYSSSYTNDLLVEVEDLNSNWQTVASRTGVSSSTTITFTESENTVVFNANGGHEDRPARVTVTTKSGSTVVGTDTQTGTVWIPTTSKATLNSNNTFNIGDSIPFTIAPYYSQTGFTYDVVMTFGGWTKTWSGFTGNSTLTFTTTDISNMYAQIPTANSGTGNIRLRTYYNGVSTEDGASANYPSGGEDQTNFTCYVKSGSSNPIFGATYTYQDTNSTTSTLTGSNQYIVQGQSTVQLNFDTTDVATGKNSASIVYYMATLGSNSCKMYVPYAKPTVSVAANSGSTLAAATYYVKYTWEHTTGYESLPSPEASIAVATGQNLVITVPSLPSGVKSVNIYMSTSAGTEKLQANITGTSYTRSTAYNSSGAVLPTIMYFSLGTTSASSNTTASIQAVDTRNNSYTTSIPITVVPYQMPVATAKAIRQDGFGTATDFTISGTYSLLSINSSVKNALSVVSVKYKKTTDSTYITPTPNLAWTVPTTPNGTYSAPTLTEQLDNTASWNVVFTITDKLTTNTVPITVGQGNPIVFVDVDKGSVGIGKFPANNDTLEINGGVSPEISGFVGTEDITTYPYGISTQYNGGSGFPSGYGVLLTFNQSINRNYQLWQTKDSNNLYIRHRTSTSTWSGWDRLLTTADEGSGNGIDADTVDGKQAGNLMWMTNANGYDGLQGPNAGTSNWIRTTTNGLLPYQSGGASSVGTASWPFNYVYSKNVEITGSTNAGVVHFDNNGNWTSVDAGIWSDNASNFGFSANGTATMNVLVDGDITAEGNFVGGGSQATLISSAGGGINVGNDGSNRIWTMDWYNRTYSTGTVSIVQTTAGTAGRATSATKYKLLIDSIPDDLPKRMLDLEPKSWWDKALVENLSTALVTGQEIGEDLGYLERAYGLIAEDLEDVGLEQFIFYGAADDEGNREVEAIYYDRMWVLLIPLVKGLYDRIEVLEDKLRRR